VETSSEKEEQAGKVTSGDSETIKLKNKFRKGTGKQQWKQVPKGNR
jgi:hypothetical protein